MRFIPTRVHGILDYLMGLILIAAPWLLGFSRGGAETYVPVVLGTGVILYSLLTDYEYGIVRAIPMSAHLIMDVIGGLVLAISPWLFNFDNIVIAPHLIFGVLEIGAGIMTYTIPSHCRTC